jgi:hypothetical protein
MKLIIEMDELVQQISQQYKWFVEASIEAEETDNFELLGQAEQTWELIDEIADELIAVVEKFKDGKYGGSDDCTT